MQENSAQAPFIHVRICDKDWILERPDNLENMWNAMTSASFTDDERIPYWTELWPSSLVLSEWLWMKRKTLQNQICLDIGCGLGLTALVAEHFGACVIGMDYEPEALRFASRNAVCNRVRSPLWTAMDWRYPALLPGKIHFAWGGDIMYEKRFVTPILDFIDYVLDDDGVMWIAEPSRSVYEFFRSALFGRGWEGRCVHEQNVRALYPQKMPVPVRLWEISRRKM